MARLKTIADAVRSSSIEQAKEFAAKVGGKTSMQTFIDRQALMSVSGHERAKEAPVTPP